MAKNVNFEKSANNGKNRGFSKFSQKRLTRFFFYFLHEDRSNHFLTHGENCMSGKNLVREIFGPELGAG